MSALPAETTREAASASREQLRAGHIEERSQFPATAKLQRELKPGAARSRTPLASMLGESSLVAAFLQDNPEKHRSSAKHKPACIRIARKRLPDLVMNDRDRIIVDRPCPNRPCLPGKVLCHQR